MNNLVKENKIESMIYEIRGKQVMLDSDLAKLYECKNGTKEINQNVKRNKEKFPVDFCFQLSEEEAFNCLRSQFVTLNNSGNLRGKHLKYLPYVFTEQGVAMLATVIHTNVASEVSVKIMRAFVAMRKYISNSLIEQKYINNLVLEDHESIKLLQESFNNFTEREKVNTLFFEGQIYNAYSLLRSIFDKAKKEIIIIDNYIDRHVLDVLKNTKKRIIICTNKYNNEDYSKV